MLPTHYRGRGLRSSLVESNTILHKQCCVLHAALCSYVQCCTSILGTKSGELYIQPTRFSEIPRKYRENTGTCYCADIRCFGIPTNTGIRFLESGTEKSLNNTSACHGPFVWAGQGRADLKIVTGRAGPRLLKM